MGWIGRMLDRIENRIERPADTGVLNAKRNEGSEAMFEADSSESAVQAAARVRRSRNRRRWRWGAGS
jgi:hypothetical protein